MEKLCLLFCLLFSINAYSQSFKHFKQEGDSLRLKSKFKEALLAYDKAIDEVVTNRDIASESDWMEMLYFAGDIVKGHNRYWNLFYGTRSEKLSEKVAFLKDAGVKHYFTYQVNENVDIAGPTYLLNTCFSSTRKTLVWVMNNNVFIQAFDDCNTYKPIKLNDAELLNILSNHYEDAVNKGFMRKETKRRSSYEFKFEFYPTNSIFNDNWINMHLFTNPKEDPPPDYTENYKNVLKRETIAYNYNINTYFYKLFVRTIEDEKVYLQKINSGEERGKIGKFE